ncbi:MAG: LapA family protein [Pseudomonadota bacterium]
MAKFISWFLGLPIAIIIIALSVANRQPVRFSFDPINSASPVLSFEIPLYLLLLLAVIIGIVVGGASSWVNQSKWRKAAREARHEMSELRSESLALKQKVSASDNQLVARNS